eukprot:4561553-Prymnesium_polylepis.1
MAARNCGERGRVGADPEARHKLAWLVGRLLHSDADDRHQLARIQLERLSCWRARAAAASGADPRAARSEHRLRVPPERVGVEHCRIDAPRLGRVEDAVVGDARAVAAAQHLPPRPRAHSLAAHARRAAHARERQATILWYSCKRGTRGYTRGVRGSVRDAAQDKARGGVKGAKRRGRLRAIT